MSHKLAPGILAVGTALGACAPAPRPMPSTPECPQEKVETTQERVQKLARKDELLSEAILDGEKQDRSLFWTCADAHQECAAKTGLRWHQMAQGPDFKPCYDQKRLFEDIEECQKKVLLQNARERLIVYYQDANACSEVILDCMDTLDRIKRSPVIDKIITAADQGKVSDEEHEGFGTMFKQPIKEFMGREVSYYVERNVCRQKPRIKNCEQEVTDGIAALRKKHKAAFDQCIQEDGESMELLSTAGDDAITPCDGKIMNAHPEDAIYQQRGHCSTLINACLTAATEVAAQ